MINWLIRKLDYLIATLSQKIDGIDEWFAYYGAVAEASPLDETPTPIDAFKVAVGFLIGISVVAWRQVLIAAGDVAILLENLLKGKNR